MQSSARRWPGGTVTNIATGTGLSGGPITGTLPIANGGTGATTALGAFNALSPLTTKGDVLVRDATNNIRLPVGTNGQVLTADSAVAAGVKWATPNADPANFPSAVPVSKGGTGATSLTGDRLLVSNGTGSAAVLGTNDAQSLTFETDANPRMTILATGKVGVNETAPTGNLHLSNTGAVDLRIQDKSGTPVTMRILSQSGANYIESGTDFTNTTSADLHFTDMMGVNKWMTIKADGKVGINTNAPATNFQVKGGAVIGDITPFQMCLQA